MPSTRSRRLLLALCVILAVALCLSARRGSAAEPPDNVSAALATAAQSCKDFGGTPNLDAVLTVKDINGDGGEDWIADYSKMKCAGGLNPMCSDEGCTLQIYLWNGGTAWNLAFEETVKSFKLVTAGRKPGLEVIMAGDACDKPSSKNCNFLYRLQKTAIVPSE